MTVDVIAHATALQHAAANPYTSVWVSANAGTGKTSVLTQRMLRLMLEQGAPPQSIHALTFTRTAASEMSTRLENILARWQRDATACGTEVAQLLGRTPTPEEQERAQGLWRQVANRPPSIQTYHSFAQSILTLQEGYDAATAPALLETGAADALKRQAFEEAVQAITSPNHPDYAAGQFLLGQLGEQHLRDVTDTALNQPEVLISNLDKLAAALHVDAATTPATLQQFIQHTALPNAEMRERLSALAAQPPEPKRKTYSKFMHDLQQWLVDYPENWHRYKAFFLTQTDEPRKTIMDKQARAAHPWLMDEIDRVAAVENTRRNMYTFLENKYLQPFLNLAANAYTHLKTAQNACDYTDLIEQATHLLQNPATGDVIHYQLDQKIQHILLDEGQDTNDKQLLLFQTIADEFFAGEGASGSQRTAFAVGDVKQSIFRFQGAAPATFVRIRDRLANKQHAHAPFEVVRMQTSFRSAPAILQAVDDIFSPPDIANQLTGGLGEVKHQAAHTQRPGQVVLWPLTPSPEKETPAPWALPTFAGVADSAARTLAAQVAHTIQTLLADTTPLACTQQPAAPRDMIILCRGRQSALWPALQQQLSARGIPFQTDQAEKALDHPIVQDMLAFLTVLLNPQDDIALLHTLRSPVCRWDIAQIHQLLRQKQKDQPLWVQLPAVAPATHRWLDTWQAQVHQSVPAHPAALLHQVYQAHSLKARFWQAYSQPGQTSDTSWRHIETPLDAFLEAAATHYDPAQENPWQHLLTTLQRDGFDLPKPATTEQDQTVRLMTIHQAKGQEAPIVFLPDTTKNMAELKGQLKVIPSAGFHLWRTDSRNRTALQSRLEQQEIDANITDELRLLYVALTRAEERLYIGGIGNKKAEAPERCWYQLIQQAAARHGWAEQGF